MNYLNDSLPHYPGLADRIRPFFTLSYPAPTPRNTNVFPQWQHYEKGALDVCFVLTWVIVFSVFREAVMSYVLAPIARRLLYGHRTAAPANSNGNKATPTDGIGNGHALHQHSKREQDRRERMVTRFSEQGFIFIYYVSYWSFGMYIWANSPWAPFNPDEFYRGYPHTPLPAPIKFYYLTQLAEWCHQVIILNIEARRKDHWQMFSHHIITIALMVTSYVSNFTRVGTMILLLMDFCDFVFAAAKMFRYVGFNTAKDVTFVFFLISWFVTRHVLFGAVIWSVYHDLPRFIPYRWSPSNGLYMTRPALAGFISLLVALQVLLLLWFYMIIVVALRVVSGQGAEDVRSDEEDE
ncbi:longevity assurance proteins LAG1/LAC1 [Calocera viscosa TUFC12733]|uniref:Longevity assurance proteins LAG1/LAC1 n=1 Tax=Calocera viscosa (strain TUFC12733) TaxID=1330018 RepID=A0A167H9K6_CALVF|nr:longevity assurance proteins LAG1/LAC1 [Calocera viscosa TUFC12733]